MRTMRSKVLCAAVAAALSPLAAAQGFGGSVWVTGIHSNVNGDNPFRFQEYRDLSNGVSAGADVRGGTDTYWYRFFGENLGRDDQFAEFRGGRYGRFKYALYGDDIVHNLTFNALTVFNGVGSRNLTFDTQPPPTDTALWNRFDYGLKHRTYGGLFELQRSDAMPFYVRTDASRRESSGVRPIGAAGTSPGGPVYELPVPIDYTTTNFSVEGGYATRAAHFSVNAAWSRFEDANDFVTWRHPMVNAGSTLERSTLAADNDLFRVGVNAMFRGLPLGSTLAVRGTWSKLENSIEVPTSYLSVGTAQGSPTVTGNVRLANPSEPTFDGEVVNRSLSASLTSQLARGLDSRFYANWYERENNSTHLVFTPSGPGSGGACDIVPAGTTATTCTPEHLHYEKKNLGVEVNWRIARGHKLAAGLDWADTERERFDFTRARELRGTLEWKATVAEGMDARVKYQHLRRKSEFRLGDDPNVFNRFLYRYDAAPLERDVLKVVFDASPTDLLELGAELILKRNDYKDTVLGRTNDRRREVYLTATWGLPEALRITSFLDFEWTRYDSMHWTGNTATFPTPNEAGTAYLWEGKVHDKNYLVGVAADWPLNPRLKLHGSAIWQKTDGGVDFATPNNLGNPLAIDAYDSFRKRSLNLRATFAATRALDVTAGYAHENYRFDDVQMDGYLHAVRTGASQNFFTGAYAFPGYNANTVYVTLRYRFP